MAPVIAHAHDGFSTDGARSTKKALDVAVQGPLFSSLASDQSSSRAAEVGPESLPLAEGSRSTNSITAMGALSP